MVTCPSTAVKPALIFGCALTAPLKILLAKIKKSVRMSRAIPQAPANYYISAQSNCLFAFYPKFPAKGVLKKGDRRKHSRNRRILNRQPQTI
jgi:hypothetical protein